MRLFEQGGGRPQSVSTPCPDVRGCQSSAPASLRSPGEIACTWLSRYGFGKEAEGRRSIAAGGVAAMEGSHGCHPIQGTVATLPLTGGCAPPVPGVHS